VRLFDKTILVSPLKEIKINININYVKKININMNYIKTKKQLSIKIIQIY